MNLLELARRRYKSLTIKNPPARMSYFELDKIVRENSDVFRLYEWRQIERWREELSTKSFNLFNQVKSIESVDPKLVKDLNTYREELRQDKNYEVSDRLRDILIKHNLLVEDNKVD